MIRALGLALLVALTVAYYYLFGAGPTPSEVGELPWWRPRGWALRWPSLALFKDLRDQGGLLALLPIVAWGAPLAAVAIPTLLRFRSALARAGVLTLALTAWAFVYYGYVAEGIWRFFSWRAPAATLSFFALLSLLLFAPSLLEAARRAGAAALTGIAVAGALAIYLLSTEITGTNPELAANLSPWPVLTLFGLLLFGYAIAVWHMAAACGAWLRSRLSGAAGLAAALLGAATVGAGLSLFVFERAGFGAVAVFAAVAAVYALAISGRRGEARAAPVLRLAAGAALAALIFASNVAASRAQERARDVLAQQVIEALERYRAERDGYPDELAELVPDYLPEVPRPRMGFIQNRHEEFTYSNFGDSFALEFASVLWVQCAYSPAYAVWDEFDREGFDDDPDEPEPDVAAGDALAASWSCESAPPDLW